ncbi:hypothetical protein [Flavobacterium ginsenosidimutans]|uniref:hypothetical protein n=1 Tax=Flavobacterium ginsenosidimutans TaxID=687844 RepID=UPI0013A67DE4|nr:hypothetical protein [Flavobacterium ginsenosidimutans]KAF2327838.1 hypothetical protein DM444_18725 [Flavobacterium ginsenosidimutans]
MKKIILFAVFIYSNFLIGQGASIVPPENVVKAFENQYPKKKATWDIEYIGKGDDVIFEAKFSAAPKTIGLARYDQNANFKSYKVQILLAKLPKKAQSYLKANYSVKSFKQFFSVVDDLKEKTFEAGVTKDGKYYNVIFDQEGEFYKRTQIR